MSKGVQLYLFKVKPVGSLVQYRQKFNTAGFNWDSTSDWNLHSSNSYVFTRARDSWLGRLQLLQRNNIYITYFSFWNKCSLFSRHYTACSVGPKPYALYSVHCKICTLQWAIYSLHCTLFIVKYALFSWPYTVYTVLCSL